MLGIHSTVRESLVCFTRVIMADMEVSTILSLCLVQCCLSKEKKNSVDSEYDSLSIQATQWYFKARLEVKSNCHIIESINTNILSPSKPHLFWYSGRTIGQLLACS